MTYRGSEAEKAYRREYRKTYNKSAKAEFMAWKATLSCTKCGEKSRQQEKQFHTKGMAHQNKTRNYRARGNILHRPAHEVGRERKTGVKYDAQ